MLGTVSTETNTVSAETTAIVTTGEAVALELPVARLLTRAAAFAIDLVFQLVLAIVLVLLAGLLVAVGTEFGDVDETWIEAAGTVILVVVLAGYPAFAETVFHGRTLGKWALGLRAVRGDGGPIGFGQALTRALAGMIVDFWILGGFGVVAVVTAACSPRSRRVGDVLADTVVIHERIGLPRPVFATTPPWLAGWATTLPRTTMTPELGLAIRQYLLRYLDLTDETRENLGRWLVSAVCVQLQIAAPPDRPPGEVLGAVIAERQRREAHSAQAPAR